MTDRDKHLAQLSEIKNLMESSTRFISLSGLSGVFAGVWAIIGAAVAFYIIGEGSYVLDMQRIAIYFQDGRYIYLLLDALGIFLLALTTGIFFTVRKARKENQPIWNKLTMRVAANLAIPLVSGGLFCIILMYHGIFGLIGPATLIFYGLALVNASKYTLNDIRFLGLIEIILGLIACFFIGYGLLFWVIGFGILHIIYGVSMYYKYER